MISIKRLLLLIALGVALTLPRTGRGQAHEATQLMLNFEKLLQFKNILKDMYKGYRILSTGYNTVKGIAEGNFKLHEAFLDGLWLASPEVRKYYRVADIVRYQQFILREYRNTYSYLAATGRFSPEELVYLLGV